MPEPPTFDKRWIVETLNRAYGATLTVELWEIAVRYGFTSWEALQFDALRVG